MAGARPLAGLMEKAGRVAGGGQWVDLGFLPALELLVESCADTGALTEQGARVLDSIVVRHLANRLLVEAQLTVRPGVVDKPVGPMIVVTGLPRTGTTLLHNLLALDPHWRSLRLWEALRPVPVDVAAGPSRDDLIRQAASWLTGLYELVPDFRAIHAGDAEAPEECDALLQNDFASQHFDDMFNAEAYSDWLASAPLRAEYRSYARQLCGLRRAEDGDGPWVLKSPSHLGHLDALIEACPEATIVQCHRHPAEAVPSHASLVLCLRRAYSDDVSASVVGRQALGRGTTALSRSLTVRRDDPGRFVDVAYCDLVRGPAVTVAALYEKLGRPWTAAAEAAIGNWMAGHPQHRYGVHRYQPDDFGLTAAAVSKAFAVYLDQAPVNLV